MGNETDDQHSAEVDPLHKLVESFLERRRRGENPSAEEYEALLPDRAGEIRDLLAALEMIERVGESHGPARGPEPAQAPGGGPLRKVGEYVLVREIGRGGMGIVYEAQQASLGRHVALKVLPFGSVLDAHLLERFRREAHAAACLHHPHIVPVFGAGEEGGVHYYAMQFIHGQPLSRVLREVKRWRTEAGRRVAASGGSGVASPTDDSAPLIALHLHTLRLSADPGSAGRADARDPERRSAQQGAADSAPPDPGPEPQDSASGSSTVATRSTRTASRSRYLQNVALLGAQVASALAYAHSQGIVHRDIKPSNLLLDSGGNIWVTDFGLAKAVGTEDLSGTGDLLGTLPYMAPERFRGWSDPRSDVYGLGITLYQVATLEPAFIDADR